VEPGRLRLGTDAWVVVHRGNAIVGYGQARREGPTVVESWGVVHPGHRGRDIGAWLLDRIQQRASELLAGCRLPGSGTRSTPVTVPRR
jgi:GNAT superfamily N-acetyltransferase